MSYHSMPWEEKYPNLEANAARTLRALKYLREKRLAAAKEGETIDKLSPRERQLFAMLVEELQQPLTDYLQSKHPKWEDILWETFLKLCESFHQYDPWRSALPWIRMIAKNALNDQCRSDDRHAGRPRRRGKRKVQSAEIDAEGADETDRQRQAARIEWDQPREQPEDREARWTTLEPPLEEREQLEKILKLIEGLPERERRILLLALEKTSYKEIARELGTTVPAVTSVVSRSRKRVIDGMGEEMRENVDKLRKRRRK